MAVGDEAEGWAEAQRRIAECRETRSESLDLSNLGLTCVPEELMELDWLGELSLKNYSDETRSNGVDSEGARALSRFGNLTKLNLYGNDIGDEGARALSGLASLTELDIGRNRIGAEGARALSGLVNLVFLNLEVNPIGDEGAQALSNLFNLTVLCLRRNGIGDEGARALSGLANLTELDIGGNRIGAEGARALSGLVNLTALCLWHPLAAEPSTENLQEWQSVTNSIALTLEAARIDAKRGVAWIDVKRLWELMGRLEEASSPVSRGNRIGDEGAQALSSLVKLTSLDLADNNIGPKGAQALSGLVNLTWLNLLKNKIGGEGAQALSPLVNLTSLNLSKNEIGANGAWALSGLVGLTWLNLEDNEIGVEGARALSGLTNLTTLYLGHNGIGGKGARALSGLTNLTRLYLKHNGIGAEGARALSGLVNLTELDLESNGIGDEGTRVMSGLVNLKELNLSQNGVSALPTLVKLRNLERLDCSKNELRQAPPELWEIPSLRKVILYEAILPEIPKELLSRSSGESCLERLRAHYRDLKGGESEIADFKLMLLGNGRVGKTQIYRRLQGQEYDETVPSTHGVKIGATPLTVPEHPATLRICDFGGQDIYHGTHALFLKSRAIFMLVWTPESEALHEHDYGGFRFRNQPLGYWLDYVREFGGKDSPVIVVQTQCDLPEQERLRPPVDDKALEVFPFKKVLHYSAKENRGRAALDEALAEAVQWLRRKQGIAVIGKGRAAINARLEKMYAKGKQLISQGEFLSLCKQAGTISSPPLLLDYLHNIGTVFYCEGLFGDAIILDQAWALDAVYAVFHREKAFKTIERYGGRFRRSDLADWAWQKHSVKEQELFLSFMQQCGICFIYREGSKEIEAEYIAPDLLPRTRDDPAIAEQLRQKWDDGCDAEATLTFELLPPGLMRSLISRIGDKAGLAAEYWRDGFYFYDRETGARALVEQRYTIGWAGEIHVQTQRGQAQALLERLLEFIDNRHVSLGARASSRTIAARDEMPGGVKDAPISPAPEPSSATKYCISYAWGDSTPEGVKREQFVDDFCAKAKARGIEVKRDKTAMSYGDRISKFMKEIGKADRIFIVLSDKYLKSTYCMSELLDTWINCKENEEEFVARTRVFVLDCAKIGRPKERLHYAKYWREKFQELDELVKTEGDLLALQDHVDHGRMRRFVYDTSNILKLVQDILKPRSFDEFVTYGFDDPPPR